MEQSSPSSLAAQHIILAQGTLLVTVKNSLIQCQVRVDFGMDRHDLGRRIPSKHMLLDQQEQGQGGADVRGRGSGSGGGMTEKHALKTQLPGQVCFQVLACACFGSRFLACVCFQGVGMFSNPIWVCLKMLNKKVGATKPCSDRPPILTHWYQAKQSTFVKSSRLTHSS